MKGNTMEDKSFGKYGCYVDGCEGDRCVLDPIADIYSGGEDVDIENCSFAPDFLGDTFGYYNCKYWKWIRKVN